MENNKTNIVEFPYLDSLLIEKNLESKKSKNTFDSEEELADTPLESENEWQQEYYIIYNSYVLDKTDK